MATGVIVHAESPGGPIMNKRNQQLFHQEWLPALGTPLIAGLVHIHGIGDNSNTASDVFKALAASGIACFSYDQAGHGRSTGDRMGTRDVDDLVDDAGLVLAWAGARLASLGRPGAALFLSGHSLGGQVAALVAARSPSAQWPHPAGLVLISPAIDVDRTGLMAFQESLGCCLAPLMPGARIVAAVRDSDLSDSPATVAAWKADARNQPGNIPVGIAWATALGFRRLAKESCGVPLLVIHGGADRTTSPKAAEAYVARAAAADKRFVALPGAKHMLFQDRFGETVGLMADFVARRAR